MQKILTKKLRLNGVTPIMLDPFLGQEEIPVEQKFYFGDDGKTLILPNSNILGFLNSQKVHSCLRLFVKSTEYQIRSNEIKGCIAILPAQIPFMNHRKPIQFTGWNDKIIVDRRMTYPNKKTRLMTSRPVINLPWSLEFDLAINPTDFITEDRILDWFNRGGFQVGLGAHRPLFGRFNAEVLG